MRNGIKIECSEINLQKDVSNFYIESYKIWQKKLKKTFKNGDINHFINKNPQYCKMLFLPSLIHDFIELPTKIPLGISVSINKLIFKILYGNGKGQE